MNIFLTILITLIFCLIGYLMGSILFASIVAKFKKVNIREVGSGNPGATNVSRSMGFNAAFIVALCDALKSYLAIILC